MEKTSTSDAHEFLGLIDIDMVKASKRDLNALSGAKSGVRRMSTTFDLEIGNCHLPTPTGNAGLTAKSTQVSTMTLN